MKFIRKHIATINKITLGAFVASWLLLFFAIPVQVAAMADSHAMFSVYNAEEGCFELVMDHHENEDSEHLADMEKHDLHSFHSSCCYDEFLVKLKKQDVDHTLTFEQPVDETNFIPSQKTSTAHYFEQSLPPPVTLDVIRVTRLLI